MKKNKIFTAYIPMDDESDKTIRIRGKKLPIISKKAFKNKYENSNKKPKIVAYLFTCSNRKERDVLIDYEGNNYYAFKTDKYFKWLKLKRGYIQVSKYEYIEVYSINIYLIIGTIMLLSGLCFYLFMPHSSVNISQPLEIEENQEDQRSKEKIVNHTKSATLPGWEKIQIKANTIKIDKGIDFYNPASNHFYKCPDCGNELTKDYYCDECGKKHSTKEAIEDEYYMSFALYLKEKDELLYQSNLVAPGKHIYNIDLTRKLKEGTYDAYVFIQPYKSDRITKCNNGKVSIQLIVK